MIAMLICICIISIIYIYIIYKMPLLVLKTKNNSINMEIKDCFITNETDDYISICKYTNKKYVFIFPGFVSNTIGLHNRCKLLYDKLNKSYNIVCIKYNQQYTSIDSLSTYIGNMIVSVFNLKKTNTNSLKYHEFHVIGCSYGASIAIDTFIKLQNNYNFPYLNTFTCHKSFNTFNRAIKSSNNYILKFISKSCPYSQLTSFEYDNRYMLYLNVDKLYIVNHINDEIINKDAQFTREFCKNNNILLIYDTFIPIKYYSLLEYFFRCHAYMNMNIIASIIKNKEIVF